MNTLFFRSDSHIWLTLVFVSKKLLKITVVMFNSCIGKLRKQHDSTNMMIWSVHRQNKIDTCKQ
jgi:hypothetical protein